MSLQGLTWVGYPQSIPGVLLGTLCLHVPVSRWVGATPCQGLLITPLMFSSPQYWALPRDMTGSCQHQPMHLGHGWA